MTRAIAVALCAFAFLPTVPAGARADSEGGGALHAELSLDAALRIGRRLQPQLRQARAQTEAAEARVDEARAPLLPQVTLNLNYTRIVAPMSGRTGARRTTSRRPAAARRSE